MRRLFVLTVAGIVVGGLVWLSYPANHYEWNLPRNLPAPAVPADNPMSDAKVELGRRLFYDTRLSVNGTISCAHCHVQELAFTDGLPRSLGATGEIHPRNAMSLVNAAYGSRLTWANHLLSDLEIQALTPLMGENPVEMGMAGREHKMIALLKTDVNYARQIPRAFPTDADPFSVLNMVRAIASFVRSIVSFESPYDRYLRGDTLAMNATEIRGMKLFFSEKTECFHCHGGFNFTDSSRHADTRIEAVGFHNNGLYNMGENGGYPPGNTGLNDMTGNRRDMGRFKAPSLRNIAVSGPYMHDGSIDSLEGVLDHYLAGGRIIEKGPYAGDGSRNPYKSIFVREFELDESEREDLLSFLHALTDTSVMTDLAFSNPFTATGE